MRILTTLTYYAPHISGLTVYARRLIREMIARGHEVTVLTSHYDAGLARREAIDGATVVRSPVAVRMSKGTLMPLFPLQAARLAARHDLVHVHLPQIEASAVALAGRAMGKPVVATYHCDIELPRGLSRFAFTPAIRLSHYLTGKLATRIVVNSADYGAAARLPRRFSQKVQAIYPPVELAAGDDAARAALAGRFDTARRPVIGFVGRFAAEKGIEVLVEAVPLVLREFPEALFVLAGQTTQVPGENVYTRLRPRMEALGGALTHIGMISDAELRALYEAMDVLALPSINSTESFGLTQAEAMLAGTPVVASDLPGVREAVSITGMGRTVAAGDAQALADGIVRVLGDAAGHRAGHAKAVATFGAGHTADAYESLFEGLVGRSVLAGVALAATRNTESPAEER